MNSCIRREHMVMRFVNGGDCGVQIAIRDDGRGLPKKDFRKHRETQKVDGEAKETV